MTFGQETLPLRITLPTWRGRLDAPELLPVLLLDDGAGPQAGLAGEAGGGREKKGVSLTLYLYISVLYVYNLGERRHS